MPDIIEERVTPNTPRVIDNQEVKVYVPRVNSNRKGIASYNTRDFLIDNTGMVSLKQPLSEQRANADPLVDPEKMAHITESGHEKDNMVSLIKLLDLEFKHVSEGEYGYDPRSGLGVLKLNREQLSEESFSKPSLVMLNSEDFLQIVTPEGYTKSGVKWPIYPMDDTTSDVRQDTFRKLGFVLDHTYFEMGSNGVLKPSYPIASDPSSVRDAENGYGMVRIDTGLDEPNNWLIFTERTSDHKKDLSFNENLLYDYITTKVNRILPNYPDSSYIQDYVISDPDDPNHLRKLAYVACFVKPNVTVISQIDGNEYSNGAQLPYGEPFDSETMVQRTLLLLTKQGIGLDKIPNLDPKNWEVSNPVRTLLNILQSGTESSEVISFAKKKDDQEYNEDVGLVYETSSNPTTIKQRIANLESAVGNLSNLSYGFIGYVTVPESSASNIAGYLNTNYPTDTPGFGDLTHIYVTNTETLWGWTSSTWVDTEINVIKGDEFQYKIGNSLKTLQITSGDTPAGKTDFLMSFDNTLLNLSINVPYIQESKYIHNWQGQLPNGVEGFTKGTSLNNLFKKFWFGTTAQYQSEFGSSPDSSIITFITDDTLEFDGNIIDNGELETRLEGYTSDLLTEASQGKTYLIAPTNNTSGDAPLSGGWGLQEVNLGDFLTLQIPKVPAITNITGAGDSTTGILRYNAMDFALIHPSTSSTDSIMGLSYKGIRETSSGVLNTISLGRENTRSGAYLTIGDLQTGFGANTNNKHLFKYLMDVEYPVANYPDWEEGEAGTEVDSTLQTSINNLWSTIINIDTRVYNQSTSLNTITNKLNKYPNPTLGTANAGNYLLTIDNSNESTQMSLLDISAIVGENPLSEQVNINSWVHGTGGYIVQAKSMTGDNFAADFAEASKVKYEDNINSETGNLKFWVGYKQAYDLIKAGNHLNPTTLYVCLDGYLYFGASLISKSGVGETDIANMVENITQTQVQTMLNKLSTV